MSGGNINFSVSTDKAPALQAFQAIEDKEEALNKKQERFAAKQKAFTDEVLKKRLDASKTISLRDKQNAEISLANQKKRAVLHEQLTGEKAKREAEVAAKEKALDRSVYREKIKNAGKLTRREKQEMRLSLVRNKAVADARKRMAGEAVSQNKKWTSGLASTAAGYIGIAGAIGLATKALAAHHAEKNRGADATLSSEQEVAKLIQLAGGDKKAAARMMSGVKASRAEAGMGEGEAAGLQFNLESLGLTKSRKLFAGLHNITGGNSAILAEGAGTLRDAMGAEETGGTRNIVNKLLVGAKASKLSVDQFAPAATIAAQSAKLIGSSDEEVLATISMLTKATKSAEVAGTQTARFASFLGKKGMGGEGMLAAAQKISAKKLNAQQLQTFIPEENARKGYLAIIQQMESIKQTQGEIEEADRNTGTGKDYVMGALSTRDSITSLKRAKALRIQEQKTLIKEQELSNEELRTRETISAIKSKSMDKGESSAWRWVRTTGAEWGKQYWGADSSSIANSAGNSDLFSEREKNALMMEEMRQTYDKHTMALIENTTAVRGATSLARNAHTE